MNFNFLPFTLRYVNLFVVYKLTYACFYVLSLSFDKLKVSSLAKGIALFRYFKNR